MTLDSSVGRYKMIISGDPGDAMEVVGLILREGESFEAAWLKNGHGWGFRLHNGHAYFLRKIKGGVSATQTDPQPTNPDTAGASDE